MVEDAAGGEASPRGWLNLGDLAYLGYPAAPLPLLRGLARVRGAAAALLRSRDWRVARDNIRAVLGPRHGGVSAERLARRWLVNQQLQRLLVVLAPRMSTAALERALPIEGVVHLEAALAGGKGAVLLGTHLNSVSMFVAAILLRRRGYDVGIALPVLVPWGDTRLRRFYDRRRGIAPLKQQMGGFYAQFNVRPIMARLKANGAVAMIGDGWHAAAFVETDFLGRRLPFPTGAFSIARTAGAPVVPAFALGDPSSAVRWTLRPPFAVPRSGAAAHDVGDAIVAWARQLEAEVRAHPAAWQHWEEEHVLDAWRSLRGQSLMDRYRV
jgi:KDO2-lipid IV(A) lauroyltransferase